jgi:hypothetical protein
LWFPQQINPASPGGRASHFQSVVGKLKPGVTLERAREEFQRIMVEQEAHKAPNVHSFDTKFHTIVMFPYHDEVVGNVKPAMLVMLAAVGFVLLIACVNVGNLLLARAESRHHEMAVRKAIGATIWDLGKQCLIEGLCLAAMGALAGLAVAWGALKLIWPSTRAVSRGHMKSRSTGVFWCSPWSPVSSPEFSLDWRRWLSLPEIRNPR